MSQESLFLIVVAVTGGLASRWMLRLAPLMSELPLKTVAASLLAAVVGAGDANLLPFAPSNALVIFTLVVAPLYIFGPLALVGLARARSYRLTDLLANLLYWTPEGRNAVKRLLVQIALQQGDADAALGFLDDRDADQLMLAQAYALQRRWDKVLTLQVPDAGDNALLALAARVQAYLALGRLDAAEAELAEMRRRWERDKGPVGYRSLVLSEARVAAERGQFEMARGKLEQLPPGVPAATVYGVAARAAEQAGQSDTAINLYREAYAHAPQGRREVYAEKLEGYGSPLPEVAQPTRPYATFGLLAAILVAYLVQSWLDSRYGQNTAVATGAFILNIPGIPAADAPWRYLSYGFLHGGIVHLGFNAWVLFDIGKMYEARRDWGDFLASFVLGTVGGALLTLVFQGNDQLILVGASGGVLGIAGALLADAWRGKVAQDKLLTRSLVQWMLIIVVFSLAIPNVSLWGHVGGVIGGFAWGLARQGLPSTNGFNRLVGGVSLALIAYALFEAGSFFFQFVV